MVTSTALERDPKGSGTGQQPGTLAAVSALADALGDLAVGGSGVTGETADAARIDLVTELERLKSAACAAQARLSAEFAASRRGAQRAAGVPAQRAGRGIGAQIALARSQSPHQGGRLLGLAQALVKEMPCTLNALARGSLDEWRATVIVRESACLSVDDRTQLDQEICGDLAALTGVGARSLAGRARRVAQRLDAAALVARMRRAENERTVMIRPAPDAMTYVTALLPMKQGVAAYAALRRAAEEAAARGEGAGGLGAVMADTFYERVTGRAVTSPVPVHLGLVMADAALFAPAGTSGAEEPAHVEGVGPVPAPWARELVTEAAREEDLWLRRLFTHPTSGQLAAMESRSRRAPRNLTRFIRFRDEHCRTPWCDAPIRHTDHITPAAEGGGTDAGNIQGLCVACNHAKQAPGWRQSFTITTTGRHDVRTITPTGHHYASAAPPLPGAPTVALPGVVSPDPVPDSTSSAFERSLQRALAAWVGERVTITTAPPPLEAYLVATDHRPMRQ